MRTFWTRGFPPDFSPSQCLDGQTRRATQTSTLFSQPRGWKQAGLVPVSGVCMENTYCMGLINIDIIYLLLWPLSVLGAIATQDLFVES